MQDDTQATGAEAPTQAVDTAEQQPSEANEQVRQEAPEATQTTAEAQEATTTEVSAEDTAQEQLLAGKYKSPEDLEKAYKELESRFGRETSEKAELTKTLNDIFASDTVAVPTQPDADDYEEPELDPVRQEVDELKRKSAVQTFILSHSDADAASMQKVLTEDPLVKQITGHEAKLEYAYLKSQGLRQSQAIAQAEKKGAERTQVKMAEKEVAQVESAQKAAPADNRAELLERMRYGDKAARAEVIGNLPAVQAMRKMAGLE